MAKMSALEKLAREICWIGFSDPKAAGCTKTEYWRRVSADAKRDYMNEARYIRRLYGKMSDKTRLLLEGE